MQAQGLIDIDYLEHSWNLTPTRFGREIIEQQDRVQNESPAADTGPLAEALSAQASSDSKLAWPSVRPVLAALRSYWEAGGFSPHGIQLPALVTAIPEEHRGLFAVTVRTLVAGNYLQETTDLAAFDMPAEVEITERSHTVLDGWPGAPDELFENLLAVLAKAIAEEEDPVRKNRLQRLAETFRDVGVSAAGEVLAKVLVGGG